jgi:hypothetical protein
MKPNSVAPSNSATNRNITEEIYDSLRQSGRAVGDPEFGNILAILDRHFPSREPQGAQQEFEAWMKSNKLARHRANEILRGLNRITFNGQIDISKLPDAIALIEDFEKAAADRALASRDRELREMREAANRLIDYIEAHGWGSIPEPYDSINPLLKLLGRAVARG